MADFAGTMKEAAFATSPREFDLSYSTTLEEIFDKLNARRTAFQMPFQIKGGVAGQRIVFEKEPNLDVTLWLYLSTARTSVSSRSFQRPRHRSAACALTRTALCARA